jgi:CHAT domain-containing protein/Tfp pilus assembly protein PilF
MRAWKIAVVFVHLALVPLGATDSSEDRMTVGAQAFDRGAFGEAIAAWKEAAALSKKAKQSDRQADALLNLGQAYHALGQRNLAAETLEAALALSKDGERQMKIKAALGAVYAFSKRDERAEPLLRESLEIARRLRANETVASILNDLGNLLAARRQTSGAVQAYQESSEKAGNPLLEAKALANLASVTPDRQTAEHVNRRALAAVRKLPDSHEKARLLLTVGRTWIRNNEADDAMAAWKQAGTVALQIGDDHTRSYAIGFLGELYESAGRREDAMKLTREAAFLAQKTQSADGLLRWEWQKGRLFAKLGDVPAAIDSYRRAITSLDPIRHDIALGFGSANRGSSFREAVGPLFFQLADLLLQRSSRETDPVQVQASLREARDTVELLKSAELVDYFQDDCVNLLRSKTAGIENISPTAAIIYLIPLPDRTEVLVGLSDGLQRFQIEAGEVELTTVLRAFRRNLETRTTYEYLTQGRQLYDWLVRPMERTLQQHGVDTLVFVPDGALRTIPLAALHDGQDFLIKRFAVAVTPGATLTDPRTVERKSAKVLLGGLSESVQGFQPLAFVPQELEALRRLQGGTFLLNKQFLTDRVGDKFSNEQFSIVHFASHGSFDRESRKTFVLTHDSKMTLDDLERFIRPGQFRGRPVELVTLSACQTAAGDDRAALGMAGIAVKSGARSAVASLWFANDQASSQLIASFYENLWQEPGISKAQAMQRAQVSMLESLAHRHPCYWAPYLVIGNWL